MKSGVNILQVKRLVNGTTVHVRATYLPKVDGWHCVATAKGYREERGPEQTGNDVWLTVEDMIDLAYVGGAQ